MQDFAFEVGCEWAATGYFVVLKGDEAVGGESPWEDGDVTKHGFVGLVKDVTKRSKNIMLVIHHRLDKEIAAYLILYS